MTEIVDPILQARALQELARKLPPGSKAQSYIFWENDHGTTGVSLTSTGVCLVHLFDAQWETESLSEAGDMLRAILADEIVAVRGYSGEVHLYTGLAPADDPSAAFSAESGTRGQDRIEIATWSRGVLPEEE